MLLITLNPITFKFLYNCHYFAHQYRYLSTIIMAFELPEEGEYTSLARAESVVQQHAKFHGYALSRASLKKDKRTPPAIRRRDLRCSRGGTKRGEGVKRATGTRMTQCEFEVRIHRTEYGTWQVRIYHPTHNHEPSSNPSEHSQYRQPTAEEKTTIQSLHESGVAPRFIVSTLLERNLDTAVTTREVYNEIAKARKERLNGLTPIEALIMELTNDDTWALDYSTDHEGHVNFLFFAPFDAIDFAQQSPDVIFIDATYRTNRYNMPLIHFLAITAIGKTVSIAMCFVAGETEAMYQHAVASFKSLVMGEAKVEVFLTDDDNSLKNALSEVYAGTPQLLCIWHVNKNVKTKVDKCWKVNTTSDEDNSGNKQKRQEFMANWQKVKILYLS